MAIQVPQSTPNAPQAVNPFGIAEAYLNRNQTQQQLFNSALGGLGSTVNELRQQKLQNQLAALNAYAAIAGKSGITAANQMVPNIPGFGINPQNLPVDPFQDSAVQNSATPAAPQTVSQDPAPSQAIGLSAAAGHPDVNGHYAFHAPDQTSPDGLMDVSGAIAKNNAVIAKASRVGGDYAQDMSRKATEANAGLAAQASAFNDPRKFAITQAAEEDRFRRTQELERQKGAAQQGDEFTKSNVKTGSGFDAFQQLEDAWNKVPATQKGAFAGGLSRHAGDLVSGKYPEAVAYNKLREGLIGAIVAGIDPQGRQGPSLLAQIEKTVPTLQTAEPARKLLMGSLYKQLESQSTRNYEGYNSAANQFGGSIPKPSIPNGPETSGLKQYSQYGQSADGNIIGSNDGKTWFDAKTGAKL